jgi:hypothetical protein
MARQCRPWNIDTPQPSFIVSLCFTQRKLPYLCHTISHWQGRTSFSIKSGLQKRLQSKDLPTHIRYWQLRVPNGISLGRHILEVQYCLKDLHRLLGNCIVFCVVTRSNLRNKRIHGNKCGHEEESGGNGPTYDSCKRAHFLEPMRFYHKYRLSGCLKNSLFSELRCEHFAIPWLGP